MFCCVLEKWPNTCSLLHNGSHIQVVARSPFNPFNHSLYVMLNAQLSSVFHWLISPAFPVTPSSGNYLRTLLIMIKHDDDDIVLGHHVRYMGHMLYMPRKQCRPIATALYQINQKKVLAVARPQSVRVKIGCVLNTCCQCCELLAALWLLEKEMTITDSTDCWTISLFIFVPVGSMKWRKW